MKYKIYNILFVLIAIGFMGMFVGECDKINNPENQDCSDTEDSPHDIFMEGTFLTDYYYSTNEEFYDDDETFVGNEGSVNLIDDFKPMINGLNITFNKAFINRCNTRSFKAGATTYCGFDTGNICIFNDALHEDQSHFTIEAMVFQGTTLVSSLSPKFVNSKIIQKPLNIRALQTGRTISGFTPYYANYAPGDYEVSSLMHYNFDFTAPAEGEYRVEYKVTEAKSGNLGEYTETITIGDTPSLDGRYLFTQFAFTCSETGKSYTTGSGDVVGGEIVFAGTQIFPSLNILFGNLSETDYPCVEGQYSFNEPGNFTKTDTQLTFTYPDNDGNMVRATFDYTLIGNDLTYTASNSKGDKATFSFTKTGLIAGR